jgi:hypothetical protein
MSINYYKWQSNISTFTNLRPSTIYPNWYSWFENKPSGNPEAKPPVGRFITKTIE